MISDKITEPTAPHETGRRGEREKKKGTGRKKLEKGGRSAKRGEKKEEAVKARKKTEKGGRRGITGKKGERGGRRLHE